MSSAFCLRFLTCWQSVVASQQTYGLNLVPVAYLGLILLSKRIFITRLVARFLTTMNQIVCVLLLKVISTLCFFFYFVDKFAVLMPARIGAVLEYISVDYHFGNISRGVWIRRISCFIRLIAIFWSLLSVHSKRLSANSSEISYEKDKPNIRHILLA